MRVPYALITRGFIIQDGRYMLCRAKGYDFWFLPGGGVEDGEDARDALAREVMEETSLTLQSGSFITAIQNRFTHKGAFENEVNLVFSGSIDTGVQVRSVEEHIEVKMFTPAEIQELTILPVLLKTALVDYSRGLPIEPFSGYQGL